MAMRLSEVHPALVHFPLTLLPIAVGVDTLGMATGKRKLHDVGKWAMAGAAVSASIAALFGLIAQEEISVDEDGAKVLKTHRTLNAGLVAALTTMAIARAGRRKPSVGYLCAGFSALAVAVVSSYFGGKLVYDHGAGVKRIGVGTPDPEITARSTVLVATQAARDLGRGVKHAAEGMRHGEWLPALKLRKWS